MLAVVDVVELLRHWQTGDYVSQMARAGRLTRLIDHYVEEREAPPRTRERAQADLASLRGQLLEMGRLAETAGAIASHLDEGLSVSYMSNEFAEAREAKQSLAVVGALCATVGRTVADAGSRLHDVDPELPGLLVPGGL